MIPGFVVHDGPRVNGIRFRNHQALATTLCLIDAVGRCIATSLAEEGIR